MNIRWQKTNHMHLELYFLFVIFWWFEVFVYQFEHGVKFDFSVVWCCTFSLVDFEPFAMWVKGGHNSLDDVSDCWCETFDRWYQRPRHLHFIFFQVICHNFFNLGQILCKTQIDKERFTVGNYLLSHWLLGASRSHDTFKSPGVYSFIQWLCLFCNQHLRIT